MIQLDQLTAAAEEGWWTLFELALVDPDTWLLIGGQMMHVLAAEHGASDVVRPTDDVDIVMNVRARPRGTRVAGQLAPGARVRTRGGDTRRGRPPVHP